MESKKGVAKRNLKAGAVILPHYITAPIECLDLVGRVLAREVGIGDTITSRDLSANDYLLHAFAGFPDLDQLVALDQQTYIELGYIYADKPWKDTNFSYPLPDKQGLSFVMTAADGALSGFWIASQRIAGQAHTHRLAIEAGCRNGLISRRLFAAHWKAVVERPMIKLLTVEVGSGNKRAQAFYHGLGYIQANQTDTRLYLEQRQRSEVMCGPEIVGAGGALSRVMTRMMETS